MGTEVAAATAETDSLDRLSAAWTGEPLPPEDCHMLLVVALLPMGVSVFRISETGATMVHGVRKHPAYGAVKPLDLNRREALRFPGRMQARFKERFVGVDVAQTGQAALVQEKGL